MSDNVLPYIATMKTYVEYPHIDEVIKARREAIRRKNKETYRQVMKLLAEKRRVQFSDKVIEINDRK